MAGAFLESKLVGRPARARLGELHSLVVAEEHRQRPLSFSRPIPCQQQLTNTKNKKPGRSTDVGFASLDFGYSLSQSIDPSRKPTSQLGLWFGFPSFRFEGGERRAGAGRGGRGGMPELAAPEGRPVVASTFTPLR